MNRQEYPSDLSDGQWRIIQQVLPKWNGGGGRRSAGVGSSTPSCTLPAPVASGVRCRTTFRTEDRVQHLLVLAEGRIWERIHDKLREKLRRASGKKATPTAAIVDSQSIRTAEGGELRGYDAGKKITGRKRHVAVDTLGLLLAVTVLPADIQDHDGAVFVLWKLKQQFSRLRVVFADSALQPERPDRLGERDVRLVVCGRCCGRLG